MTKPEFKKLYDNYFDDVRRFIYYRSGNQDIATDITQECFMRLWEKQLLPDKNKEKALLFKIANDMFISSYRKLTKERDFKQKIEFDLIDASPEDELQYKELKGKYEIALSKLTEKQRTVFLLSRIDGLKYKEIAEHLNISVKAVEKRMKYALDYLKGALLNQPQLKID